MKNKKIDEAICVLSENGQRMNDSSGQVASSFKSVILELRDFLTETKKSLDAEERKIEAADPEEKTRLELQILDSVEKPATEYIDQSITKMTEIVQGLKPWEHRIYKKFFQEHLHPLLLLSPFVKRTYTKPLGIPGDYKMMDMLYGNHDQGETLFAKLMNRHCCRVAAGRAVIGRVPSMLSNINQTIGKVLQRKETVSILNIGCGPAREIQKLIETNPLSDRCRVTLIDVLPEALRYCHETLGELKKKTGSRIEIHCLHQSVYDLIHDAFYALDLMGEQDLIYTIGLFDYLPRHVAKHVIQKLYRQLQEGGRLIIGNLSTRNAARYYMEYGAEWHLIYRTPEEMVRLTEGGFLPQSKVSIEADEEGTQLYLTVEKRGRLEEEVTASSATTTPRHAKL